MMQSILLYIGIAFAVLVSATLIQHLGLAEAIAKVTDKVLSCNQCLSFWSVLVVLVYMQCHPIMAALLAILSAYLSNWLILLLMFLQRLFSKLYEYERDKVERKKVER